MTGSIVFNRQHSTTAVYPTKHKVIRPKLRRCSSVDDHSSFEITPDENSNKEKFFSKFDSTASDSDSGIEDFDQQVVNTVIESNNNNEDEQQNEEFSPVFGTCDNDENLSQITIQENDQQLENTDSFILYQDLELAGMIKHDEKKDFCADTSVVFHAEFARLISMPISLFDKNVSYYLLPEDACDTDPCLWPDFAYVKLDNAKAQFKCPNPLCRRLWTSMRARISFKISYPIPHGFVTLKIFGQNCQLCKTPAEPLWYMEEVCRVMENLATFMSTTFFCPPSEIECLSETKMIDNSNKYYKRSYHDPQQRKGKMRAPHDRNHCHACQNGVCYS